MEAKPKFDVIYSDEVIDFLNTLPAKAKAKVMFNVSKARYNQDPKLFKKLVGTDIWEFSYIVRRIAISPSLFLGFRHQHIRNHYAWLYQEDSEDSAERD